MLTTSFLLLCIISSFTVLLICETLFGLTLKGDYDKFNKHLIQIARKELIYLVYHNTLSELNKNRKGDAALGLYVYSPDKISTIEMAVHNLPRIELSKEHMFGSKKSLLSLMTFAHEIGHHFSIKEKDDKSESSADKYAIKLLKNVFPTWKLIFYYPIIFIYSTKR